MQLLYRTTLRHRGLCAYDVALRDDVSHSPLVESLNANSEVSEVVLIASKNDVNY
ncbi:hypothetical protein OAI35_02760 [Paracoccaceae bacterium]|nr:hypothetical protein [Paracoccaceae bacterium]